MDVVHAIVWGVIRGHTQYNKFWVLYGVIPGLVYAAAGFWHGSIGDNREVYAGVIYICAWFCEQVTVPLVYYCGNFQIFYASESSAYGDLHEFGTSVQSFHDNAIGK